jgi:HTH-type transcriptional regulator / antitoxin HigA
MLNQIKTQADYDIALERVYKLMQENITPNSKESDELENLSFLIKEFESKAYKLPNSNTNLPIV